MKNYKFYVLPFTGLEVFCYDSNDLLFPINFNKYMEKYAKHWSYTTALKFCKKRNFITNSTYYFLLDDFVKNENYWIDSYVDSYSKDTEKHQQVLFEVFLWLKSKL